MLFPDETGLMLNRQNQQKLSTKNLNADSKSSFQSARVYRNESLSNLPLFLHYQCDLPKNTFDCFTFLIKLVIHPPILKDKIKLPNKLIQSEVN